MVCRAVNHALLLALFLGVTMRIGPAIGADANLRIGFYENAPKIFSGENGKPNGFWPNLVGEISRQKGWSVNHIKCEWADCLRMLESGEIDVMPDVAYSAERTKRFQFGKDVVFHSWSRVYYLPSKSIGGILDLSEFRIAILSGSIQEERLGQRLIDVGINPNFVEVKSLGAVLKAVSDGDADAGVVNRFLGAQLAPQYGLVPSGIVVAPSAVQFAFSRKIPSNIISGFDEIIAKLKLDGASIYYRELSKLTDSKSPNVIPIFLYWVAGVGLTLLFLSLGTVLLLRRLVATRTRELRSEINERKEVEETLRGSEARYRGVVEDAPGLICSYLPTGEITFANKAYCQYFDKAYGELVGSNFQMQLPESDQKTVMENLSALTLEAPMQSHEHAVIAPGGEIRWQRWTNRALFDAEGIARSYQAIGEDITDRHRMEQQLFQASKMEAIGQLTGGIAHDFNNLLGVLLGNLELIKEKLAGNDTLKERVNTALSAVERGASLTQRLLAFSRKQALQPVSISVDTLIKDMLDLLRRTLGETIEVEVVHDAGLWRTEVDPNQLESAILNIAINARDAMPDGGKLTIEESNARLTDEYAVAQTEAEPGQYVLIAITDTGVGMSPEVRERAFEPFYTTKNVGEGTGLGLSMVYGFVKQSNGHVSIYSEIGEGTTIKLYLPRAENGRKARKDPEPMQEVEQSQGEVVLVVEDDPDLRDILITFLQSLNYDVLTASTGATALDTLQQSVRVDLLLTDIVLPEGMSGVTLAGRTQEIRSGLSVLYMSGYTENAIIHRGRLDEGVRLLQKPFSKQDLARLVREALNGHTP